MLDNLEVKKALSSMCNTMYNKEIKDCNNEELYYAILQLTKAYSNLIEEINGDKKVYYVSAEFLIGKLLSNNLINLGLYDKFDEVLKSENK